MMFQNILYLFSVVILTPFVQSVAVSNCSVYNNATSVPNLNLARVRRFAFVISCMCIKLIVRNLKC